MRHSNRNAQGFTLIELMIAVAIIGILSASAISSFQFLQLRSRRSEASANLAAIRTHQLSYFHENGAYVFAPPSPAAAPLGPKQPWSAIQGAFSPIPNVGFAILAFQPEGGTYYDYDTNTALLGGGPAFTASAYGDADLDGNVSAFAYIAPDSLGNTLPSLAGPFTTVWVPGTCQVLLNTVGQVPWQAGCGFPTADDF